MKTKMRRNSPAKPTPMKALGLAEASKHFEGVTFGKTRKLTVAEQGLWERAKRGPGRPRKSAADKAARVLVTIAPTLLARADGYARREGISRAQLFARGLTAVLATDRGNRKTG